MTLSSATTQYELPAGVVFSRDEFADAPHQQVAFFQDQETGLRAIIAVHSTNLGPALGGTRFYPYLDEYAAVTDVLRLSRGMTYKAAVAGLPLGGGKAVIIGDPHTVKSEALLEAYGRVVEGFEGRYITAGDVGTTADDMDVVGRETKHVVARNAASGGSGDSAPLTALGVFHAILAAAEHVWGSGDLAGRTVGVEGVGKVGRQLIGLLLDAGAQVVASDISPAALDQVRDRFPSVNAVTDVLAQALDVYAPCAMGATITEASVGDLSASIVCGAANNQLATPGAETILHGRGITWVPDYVANAGGLIQVAGELAGATPDTVHGDVENIATTVRTVLESAHARGITTGTAAFEIAAARVGAAR
ncbi:MAG: Glu/Leu/Phe/Val dehydrogenase [Rhodococcus sp. (in: high G+C Gram-positive bacteria)]|nr:MAG: Glu/Leu/Phe/Val dehydrogenase [Rhodococcus sp. (in: high G+C Gram-positive bacteria)]